MRTSIVLGLVLGAAFAVGIGKADAAAYLNDSTLPVKAGTCILVSTPAEADAGHVYTLNPDHTIQLNIAYVERWSRNAGCSELQFHVDHSTPLTRLHTWLDSTAFGWYENLGSTHFNGQTVSTTRREWFLVDGGVLRRIPDWLTAMAWGLLVDDRISIPPAHTDVFYNSATIGSPLQFSEGMWYRGVNAFWKDGNRNYTRFPFRLREEMKYYVRGYPQIFSTCPTPCGSTTDRNCGNLLDWRWLQSTPGYQVWPSCREEF